jgi:hypothetical protein
MEKTVRRERKREKKGRKEGERGREKEKERKREREVRWFEDEGHNPHLKLSPRFWHQM